MDYVRDGKIQGQWVIKKTEKRPGPVFYHVWHSPSETCSPSLSSYRNVKNLKRLRFGFNFTKQLSFIQIASKISGKFESMVKKLNLFKGIKVSLFSLIYTFRYCSKIQIQFYFKMFIERFRFKYRISANSFRPWIVSSLE